MMNAVVILALAIGQPPPVPRQPQAPPIVEYRQRLSYADGCKQSLATGKELLVYVGTPSKANDAAIVCETASLEGYPAKCIVVSRPDSGAMYWVKTLDEHGKEVRPVAATFRPVQFSQSAFADCTSGG